MALDLLPVIYISCLIYLAVYFSKPVISKCARLLSPSTSLKQGELRESKDGAFPAWNSSAPSTTDDVESKLYKKLYHEVQNLEEFPEVLPLARKTLNSLLSETLCMERRRNEGSILSLERFDKEELSAFIQRQDELVAEEWEAYLARRKAGGKRELFETKDEARDWLTRVAPLKLVDGAWLGHIHRVTTPFALRNVTKGAWQVMAEEYGDGNLECHHVHLYEQLLQEAGAHLPEAFSSAFIQPDLGLDNPLPWKAAVAQLLISLFPHDFLPEILGYNMHFELLTLDTMKAAKELEEIKLDPYYFFLHISVDNRHSGHSAMAMAIVVMYIDHIHESQGPDAANNAWKRVQAGYCLSSGLGAPSDPTTTTEAFPQNEWNHELIVMLQGKAQASGKIHCGSRIKVGGRSLTSWLAPESFESEQRQKDFLRELANWKPWVRKGDSTNSRLIHALSWGGKMFGSFTENEMSVVRGWIDGLCDSPYDPHAYHSFVEPNAPSMTLTLEDVRVDYPVMSSARALDISLGRDDGIAGTDSPISPGSQPVLSSLIPLWFAHISLLEGFVAVPARTANKTSCAVVRLLRCYYGFESITDGVAGMDEVRKHSDGGLVELGLRILRHAGDLPEPSSLKQVLDLWPHPFALEVLQLSMRPVENRALLLGMVKAFVELHEAVARSGLLVKADRDALASIVGDERTFFVELEKTEMGESAQFQTGFAIARKQVQSCVQEASAAPMVRGNFALEKGV